MASVTMTLVPDAAKLVRLDQTKSVLDEEAANNTEVPAANPETNGHGPYKTDA